MTQKLLIRICALVLTFSGLTILFSTVYPILSYEWEASQKYAVLISPLVEENTGNLRFGVKDYTKLSNWFNEANAAGFSPPKVDHFTLSVPKLGIENATVTVGSEDLSESLIQYPGTALPGKIGNSVIFGHSVLPQYFDPTNYLSIFSTLPKLEKGDFVYANYDGITYQFVVEDMFEVRPTDIQILEQTKNGSYLSLVTCSPPGHPLKPRRLIVRTKLVPVQGEALSLGAN